MSRKKAKSKRKSELKIIFFIILIAAMLFIVSTYAWFSTQRNVSITNLSGIVEVAEGLEISLDAEHWSNGIVLGKDRDAGQLDLELDAYEGHNNLIPTEMLPASTLGLVPTTYDKPENSTMTGLNLLRGNFSNSKKLESIAILQESNKTMVSGVSDGFELKYPGYFAFDIFLKNTSRSETIPDILQLNYDSSLQIIEGGQASTGLQNTARVAFVKYGGYPVAGTDDKVWAGVTDSSVEAPAQILAATGAVEGGDDVYVTDVAIWEPNANDHVEYIVKNNNKITWTSTEATKYATKTLADGKKGFDVNTQMPTYALSEASIGKTIDDIYDWSGTNSTTLDKQTTLQTTKTDASDYTIKEGVKNLKSTTYLDDEGNPRDFKIAPNSICRLKIYVWLEGQDVDCINYASHGGGITLNIGLVKSSKEGSHGETVEVPEVPGT